jgi:hypothetical protein
MSLGEGNNITSIIKVLSYNYEKIAPDFIDILNTQKSLIKSFNLKDIKGLLVIPTERLTPDFMALLNLPTSQERIVEINRTIALHKH